MGFGDGSCVRLREAFKDHVWSYDFVHVQTYDGGPLRLLTVIDEHTRECLAIDVARRMTSENVLERLSGLFVRRGVPRYLRSDNGSEFTARKLRVWLERVDVTTLFIEPGSPWENGYIESFNGKLRDELLNGEIFETKLEAKVLIERWRVNYNTIRPHSTQKAQCTGLSTPGTVGGGRSVLPIPTQSARRERRSWFTLEINCTTLGS